MTPVAETSARLRANGIDRARGIALLAMAGFHLVWDCVTFALLDPLILYEPAFRAYGAAIAASFIALSGVSTTLARPEGLLERSVLKRLLRVGASALAVSLVTWIALPDSYVRFGILHHIFAASLIGISAWRWPSPVLAVLALCFAALPLVFPLGLVSAPMSIVLGLPEIPPNTVDTVPLIPWLGAFFAGLLAGKNLRVHLRPVPALRRVDGLLCWLGRHSLFIYLTHQIVLVALVAALALILGTI